MRMHMHNSMQLKALLVTKFIIYKKFREMDQVAQSEALLNKKEFWPKLVIRVLYTKLLF